MAEEEDISPEQEIDFCTLGMFIIDEIHYHPPKPPVFDIIGGGGTYSALGARLFSPPLLSRTVSWIIDRGTDFPSPLTELITSWSTTAILRTSTTRLTTRGWNGYSAVSQQRAFRYATPKLRLEVSDLKAYPQLLFSKSFHLICNPTRCITIVTSILRHRKHLNPTCPKPLIIWEPVPDLMTPSELLNTTNALPYVDICSPNHSELASLLGDPLLGLTEKGEVSTAAVESACEQLLSAMPLQSYTLVVRCGEKGVFLAKNGGRSRRPSVAKRKRPANHARGGLRHDTDMESLFAGLLNSDNTFIERDEVAIDPGTETWLPAYHTTAEKVVDPTGGGNGFLGGLAIALARNKSLEEAACWGNVAASFCIEQVGVPVLSGEGEEGCSAGEAEGERWNSVSVAERLEEYVARVRRERGVVV